MRLQYEPDNTMPHFVIKGTFPSLNEYLAAQGRSPYRGGSMKREYMMLAVNAIRRQLDRHYKPQNPIIIHYRIFEPNKKKDHDNSVATICKIVQDGLQAAGVIPNDGWANIENFTHDFFIDKSEPRVEVYLEEIE